MKRYGRYFALATMAAILGDWTLGFAAEGAAITTERPAQFVEFVLFDSEAGIRPAPSDSKWLVVDAGLVKKLLNVIQRANPWTDNVPVPQCPAIAGIYIHGSNKEEQRYIIPHIHEPTNLWLHSEDGRRYWILADGKEFLSLLSSAGINTQRLFSGDDAER